MSRPVRWGLTGLVELLVLMALALWRMHTKADEILERERRTVDAALAAALADAVERPALDVWPAGRPLEERIRDARVVYTDVLTALAAIPWEELTIHPEVNLDGFDDIDEDAVSAFFVRYGDIFESLDAARTADRVSRDPALAEGLSEEEGDLGAWMRLLELLDAHFRHSLVRDNDTAALQGARRALLVGHDLSHYGTMIHRLLGFSFQERGLDQLRLLLARGRLDADALAEVAEDLASMAPATAVLDLERTMRLELLVLRKTLVELAVDPERSAGLLGDAEAGWKHVYSTRILLSATLEELSSTDATLSGIDELSWTQAIARVASPGAEPADHADMFAHMLTVVVPTAVRRMAGRAVDMNLARVAFGMARYRHEEGAWPGSLDDLVPRFLERIEPCPVTGLPLGYTAGKVWSGGGDGDDDGGRALRKGAEWGADGDVVWNLGDTTLPDPFEDLR